METRERVIEVIRYYNKVAKTSIRCGNENNVRYVIKCIGEDFDDIKVRQHIRDYVETSNPATFEECFMSYEKNEVKNNESTPQPQVTEQAVGSAMGILEQAVVGMISQMQAEKIEQNIMNSVQDEVRNFIKSEYGAIERKINTVINGEKKEVKGIQHEKFDTVLKFVANDEPVFLTGPAGSGKNVLCKQVAEALGLDFYFTNAVTQEYKLTGFTDAMGNYQETQFYKAFTQGGLFMLDEMDASIPEVLVILNSAIANRYFDFPAPIGYVEAHPDFRVISAGNTVGHGADFEYVGRNQLDGASLDRFAIVKIDYCEEIENSVAGDIEVANFCREFRNSANSNGINVIISYRGIGRFSKMLNLLTTEEALETCLIKGLEIDDVRIIANGIQTDSKYSKALKKLSGV